VTRQNRIEALGYGDRVQAMLDNKLSREEILQAFDGEVSLVSLINWVERYAPEHLARILSRKGVGGPVIVPMTTKIVDEDKPAEPKLAVVTVERSRPSRRHRGDGVTTVVRGHPVEESMSPGAVIREERRQRGFGPTEPPLSRDELARRRVEEEVQVAQPVESLFRIREVLEDLYVRLYEGLNEVDWSAPRSRATILAEIRETATLAYDVIKETYNLKAIQEFQEVVIEVLEDVDPSVKRQILAELKRRRSERQEALGDLLFRNRGRDDE
jgi:hypothetical protein